MENWSALGEAEIPIDWRMPSPSYPTPWKGPDSLYVYGEDYYPLLGCSYPPIDSKYWKSKKILKRLAEEHPQFYEDNFGKGKPEPEPDPDPEPVDPHFYENEYIGSVSLLPISNWNKRIPLDKDDPMRCAEASLSSWNKKSLFENGPEYELVPAIYHCNFIARPKDSTDDKLFFAELVHDYEISHIPCAAFSAAF